MDHDLVLPVDFKDYAWEVDAKGYLTGASVRVGDRLLAVTFYEPVRLAQDIAGELAGGRPFGAVRILVVERVREDDMRAAIAKMPAEFFL